MTRTVIQESQGRDISRNTWGKDQLYRRPAGISFAEYEIKLYDEETPDEVKSPRFGFSVPKNVNGLTLVEAEAFYSNQTGPNDAELLVYSNTNGNLINTNLVIPAFSYHSSWPADIIPDLPVLWRDRVFIDTVVAGGGLGLGVILKFGLHSPPP